MRQLELTVIFFFLLTASLEVKSKAPNGVTFNVKGKSAHEGPIAGSVSVPLAIVWVSVWCQVANGCFVDGIARGQV